MDLTKFFIDKGIYKLKTVSDSIFLCEALTGNRIGKLVQYKKEKNHWKRTNFAYFITTYSEDEVKSIFIVRENYDMLGRIDVNYVFRDNKQVIQELK